MAEGERFGSLDEELSGTICASQQRFAIVPLLQLRPEELTRLLRNFSREELLERFGGHFR